MKRLPLTVVVAGALVSTALAQERGSYALTPESLARAMADNRGVVLQLSLVAAKANREDFRVVDDGPPNPELALRLLRAAPFEVRVLTPYMRAAITAADAKRRFADVPKLTPDMLNADGIVVSIAPAPQFVKSSMNEAVIAELETMIELAEGRLTTRRVAPVMANGPATMQRELDDLRKAGSIQNVVLSVGLDETIIRPVKTALEQRTITNALGASKIVIVGAFYFKLTDFNHLPLRLICVGESETLTLFIDDADLVR